MNWKTPFLAVAIGVTAAALVAQETKKEETTTTQQSQQNPDGSIQSTTTKTTTVTGSVVRYTPGQTIVIQSTDGKTTTYTLGPSVEVPAAVQVGERVTISTEPASDGSGPAMVTRVETISLDSQGQMKSTTERTETSPSGETTRSTTVDSQGRMKTTTERTEMNQSGQVSKTTTTTVYGTVTAYEPGQSITIERPGQQTVTYTIDTESKVPENLVVGKSVTIRTTTIAGSSAPVARQITYRTVTKTTKSKTVSPQ